MLPAIKKQIISLMQAALAEIAKERSILDPLPEPHVERPKVVEHGDLATNIAMQLSKAWKANPRELAQVFVEKLMAQVGATELIASAEIAGPGFINLRLTQKARLQVIGKVFAEGNCYGQQAELGKKVLVEFVSANPTGPLHVGHGRQAALGDALSNILKTQGWSVHKEFYYNDAGAQINNLAISVQARARGQSPDDPLFPADGYRGDYIAEIAQAYMRNATVKAADGEPFTASGDVEDLESIRRFAVTYLRHEQDLDLRVFGVAFDRYYLESSLYLDGLVESTVNALIKSGTTYEQDGALWLRTTDFGDDKDRVMRKSDGNYTYFVPDIAYHVTKWERGFSRAINIQGADHHGTVSRVRAGLQALDIGIPKTYPDYVLHKMVTVMRGGQEVKISKRAGSYVTLRDLITWSGEIDDEAQQMIAVDEQRGRDAVRFFLVSRKADSEFVFDVDLALSRSEDNPVYYVQYAHARVCSVLAQAGLETSEIFASLTRAGSTASWAGLLGSPKEHALLNRLSAFPETIAAGARELSPHVMAFYLRELAADFHAFYNSDRVLVEDAALRQARLYLVAATGQVLRLGLALLGVSAPTRM